MGPFSSMKKYLVMSVLALATSQAFAGNQFTVSGSIQYVQDGLTGVRTEGGTFDAVVSFDPGTAGYTTTGSMGSTSNWYQSVLEVSYRVYDTAGNQVFSSDITSAASDPAAFIYSVTTAQDSTAAQTLQWILFNSDAGASDGAMLSFSDANKQLFISTSQYPDPTQLQGHLGTLSFSSTGSDHSLTGVGDVTNVSFGPADTDGDGITDDMDQCPNSILTPTVIVNGVDSGIPNTLQLDGCTLADMLGDPPPNVVAYTTNQMVKDGLISGRSKGMIQSAGARSEHSHHHDGSNHDTPNDHRSHHYRFDR